MKEGWTNRWKRLLIWVSGYLSIIAYVIVGGYFMVKSDDEDLKKDCKICIYCDNHFHCNFSIFGNL